MSNRRKLFYGFTLSVIVLLLTLPATGWLARLQLLPFLQPSPSRTVESTSTGTKSQNERFDRDAQTAISANPGNFSLRYAHALEGDSSQSVTRLERLNAGYPRDPKILAALLRYSTLRGVKVKRPEQKELGATTYLEIDKKPTDPAQVAGFLQYARQGEAVDPANAFFPAMTAVGLFASGQDAAAIAAWVRAAGKPVWNEYVTDEVTAKWQLQRAMNGGNETRAVDKADSIATLMFPHYSAIRASARMAVVHAVRAEVTGNVESGFALRRATRQIGRKMTTQGRYMIPCFVGSAVVEISSRRPGGALLLSDKEGESIAELSRRDRSAYLAYLQKIGHPEEAKAYEEARAQGKYVKTLWDDARHRTYWGFGEKTYRLFGAWCVSFLMIAGAVFSLTFAGIFKVIYRFSARVRKGEPLQKSAVWGVASGSLLALIAGVFALSGTEHFDAGHVVGTFLGLCVVLFVLPPFLLRLSVRDAGHGFLVALATWGFVAVLVGAAAICGVFARPIGDMVAWFAVLSGDVDGTSQTLVKGSERIKLVAGMILSVPFALIGIFGVCSKILRVPLATGVTRGMRAAAVPLAAVLALCWAGTLIYTLNHERAATREMERMMAVGEAQYMAEVIGKPFPK